MQRHEKKRIRYGNRSDLGLGIACIWLCLLVACAHGTAGDPRANLFEDTLQVYRGPLNHLSAVRRGACPMHPSCSEYGRRAVREHGFLIGWAMAMDRLLRCGRDEVHRAPKIRVDGQWKFYDPVAANDAWWYAGRPADADINH